MKSSAVPDDGMHGFGLGNSVAPVVGSTERREKPLPPEPPARTSSSPEFVYVGRTYGLAHARDYFGIYRNRMPWRPPLFAFPRDASGWEQAWREFCRLEPLGAPTLGRGSGILRPRRRAHG